MSYATKVLLVFNEIDTFCNHLFNFNYSTKKRLVISNLCRATPWHTIEKNSNTYIHVAHFSSPPHPLLFAFLSFIDPLSSVSIIVLSLCLWMCACVVGVYFCAVFVWMCVCVCVCVRVIVYLCVYICLCVCRVAEVSVSSWAGQELPQSVRAAGRTNTQTWVTNIKQTNLSYQ